MLLDHWRSRTSCASNLNGRHIHGRQSASVDRSTAGHQEKRQTEVQNLIILTPSPDKPTAAWCAAMSPMPSIDQMPEDLELRRQTLPEPAA